MQTILYASEPANDDARPQHVDHQRDEPPSEDLPHQFLTELKSMQQSDWFELCNFF